MAMVTISVDSNGKKLRILSDTHILSRFLVVLSHLAKRGNINATNSKYNTDIMTRAGSKEAPIKLPLVRAQ